MSVGTNFSFFTLIREHEKNIAERTGHFRALVQRNKMRPSEMDHQLRIMENIKSVLVVCSMNNTAYELLKEAVASVMETK